MPIQRSIHTTERNEAGRRRPVTRSAIAAIAQRAFGSGAVLLGARELATGSVNSTWELRLAGEEPFILRVGPTEAAATSGPSWLPADTLQREYALTPWLAPVAPLLPKTVVADFTHQAIDCDWVIQTRVAGQAWSDVARALTREQEASLWRQLGGITRRIHSVEGSLFGPLPPGPTFGQWSELLAHDSDGILVDFERFALSIAPARTLRELIGDNATKLDVVGTPRMIHSDLDRRHVFFTPGSDGALTISGIIDYEFGRFADPLSEGLVLDLVLHQSPAAAPFFEGYGAIPDDEATRWRTRLYQAIILGWTAGDQARQEQNAFGTVAALDRMMRELAGS